jgi:hypothetical protein
MPNYKKCPTCNEYFEVSRGPKTFCSSRCRLRHFRVRHPNYYQQYKIKRNKTVNDEQGVTNELDN